VIFWAFGTNFVQWDWIGTAHAHRSDFDLSRSGVVLPMIAWRLGWNALLEVIRFHLSFVPNRFTPATGQLFA
jgi:hypothetical protein